MSTTDADRSDRIEPLSSDLSPSAKLVYKVLEYEGELTQAELVTETRLCQRTVRYAIGKLEHHELVDSRAHLEDARQSVYHLDD